MATEKLYFKQWHSKLHLRDSWHKQVHYQATVKLNDPKCSLHYTNQCLAKNEDMHLSPELCPVYSVGPVILGTGKTTWRILRTQMIQQNAKLKGYQVTCREVRSLIFDYISKLIHCTKYRAQTVYQFCRLNHKVCRLDLYTCIKRATLWVNCINYG